MTKRTGIIVLAVVAALFSAASAQAVTLINPDGSPVGGVYQQWANESRTPTYNGTVIFSADTSACGGAIQGCSDGAPWTTGNTRGMYYLWANTRDSLYYELGHIFDWSVLTWRERTIFAKDIWNTSWHWEDSLASMAQGTEDGLEGVFPGAYDACAWGQDLAGTTSPFGHLPGIRFPPSLYQTTDTASCSFLLRVGVRAGTRVAMPVRPFPSSWSRTGRQATRRHH